MRVGALPCDPTPGGGNGLGLPGWVLYKSSMHIGMRRLRPQAVSWMRGFDSLCKALAFSAVAACPLAPCLILPRSGRGRERGGDARNLAIRFGRLAGFVPSRHQPLPGRAKLWQALSKLRAFAQAWAATRAAASPATTAQATATDCQPRAWRTLPITPLSEKAFVEYAPVTGGNH